MKRPPWWHAPEDAADALAWGLLLAMAFHLAIPHVERLVMAWK